MTFIAIDFESDAIESRPSFPPRPVGLAEYVDGGTPFYYAWGHPTKNNSSFDTARARLVQLFERPENRFIFHNAPFDCSIIEERFDLTVPWDRVEDTMLLAFLLDPFGELSLKPLAEKHLGEAPTERDAVRDWLVSHGVCRSNDKSWGAHIGKAPGDLVGAYAIGDVRKTLNLFTYFTLEIERRNKHATGV
jgi:DNA polymerase I-like protein with 3'-5' exonuclease and polymerase domains